jgi:hypothetical protein
MLFSGYSQGILRFAGYYASRLSWGGVASTLQDFAGVPFTSHLKRTTGPPHNDQRTNAHWLGTSPKWPILATIHPTEWKNLYENVKPQSGSRTWFRHAASPTIR